MEWFSEGMVALISGMGTTFLVLIFLSWLIGLLKYVNKPQPVKVETVTTVTPAPAPAPAPAAAKQDDSELVAVIAAAIAATLNTTTDKFQVRSFRRLQPSERWNAR
ncbi:OadG family protein [Anaerotalea alkaliphila]|uniref:OadG family protein n=1 Tax=Anaerotalea alkaliphila TaxID=2662126 RepID=A0A7X5HTC6_9FIRM|nr:OadG family protein [Anaerotalea alkaliphila]NDL66297.1 OadG family protein [Anaerotalea alkaliphila]